MLYNPLAKDLDHILAHTQDLWNELRGQRIFIAGGTGFFGCWLLESFVQANERLQLNAEMVVLTRNYKVFANKAPHLAKRPDIHFHIGDVRTFDFPKGPFSCVIHAASDPWLKLDGENPMLMFDIVVTGTRRILEFASSCEGKKVLLTSSGAVYGPQPSDLLRVPEDFVGAPSVLDPRSAYGEGKRVAEWLGSVYASECGLEVKIARPFAFVGPHLPLDMQYAVGNFIRDGLNGGPIRVNGDGMPVRSFLYTADLAIWLWTILLRGKSCHPYNVGSTRMLSVRDAACTIAKVFGGMEVFVAQEVVPGKPVSRYVPDISRAECELGLREWIGFEEGVRRTIAWHQQGGKTRNG